MADKFLVDDDEHRYKIILIGDVSVGKTAMFWRYVEGEFLASKETLVTTIDFKMKQINIHNKTVKLFLWDTAGSEKYRSIVSTYFKGCEGVLLMFDLSRESSFSNAIETWYQLARSKTKDAVFVLVGNKSDLDIRVNERQVKEWCEKEQIAYMETSVKENKNISETFELIANKIYDKKKRAGTKRDSIEIQQGKSRKKCCE